MVKSHKKSVEVDGGKVVVNGFEYDRKIDALELPNGMNGEDYVMIFQGDESNVALSNRKQFGGANFYETNRMALDLGKGKSLASAREFTPVHRDVNLALQGRGVVYDALGNLIEGEKLINFGRAVNRTWAYLNDVFFKSEGEKGFLGLDIARVVGFNENNPIFEREPLEEHVHRGWADVESINSQGLYTRKAPVQKFEQGKTIYIKESVEGSVVLIDADSFWASIYACGVPQYGYPGLGGFVRAEGMLPKNSQREKENKPK